MGIARVVCTHIIIVEGELVMKEGLPKRNTFMNTIAEDYVKCIHVCDCVTLLLLVLHSASAEKAKAALCRFCIS